MNVSYNNNDIILKYMARAFEDVTLDFLGIVTPKITGIVPTELPVIDIKDEGMDFAFELEDNSYLHLEFQTTDKSNDIIRFGIYDFRLFEKDLRQIRTVVIYSGNIKNANTKLIIGPKASYGIEAIYMFNFDGDAIFEELKNKILTGIDLSDLDRLNLIFLPLMKSSINKNEMAIKSIELAKEINDNDKRMFCIAAIVGISDKFIDPSYIMKLKEVFELTKVGYLLKQEGINEGIEINRKNTRELVKNLLLKGVSKEVILASGDFTAEEIDEILLEIKIS